MSTTSLLYHAFGVVGYHHVKSEYTGGAVRLRFEDNRVFRCTHCGSSDVIKRGANLRRFRAVPIGRKPVFIEVPIQRVGCVSCGNVRPVETGFADERRTDTRAFERFVPELSKSMTISDVARHLGVSWDTVKDIQKRNLERRYAHISLRDVQLHAIDEISIGKGHRYMTIVLDLKTGAIVFVGEGRGSKSLDPFWEKLRHSKARIKAVAMDMSPAYALAVHKHLPKSVIVFDHFHIIKMFNEQLSELRRALQNQVESGSSRVVAGFFSRHRRTCHHGTKKNSKKR